MLTRLRDQHASTSTRSPSLLAQPWEAAKSRFLEGLSTEEIHRFRGATPENVFYGTSAAQKKFAADHTSWIMQDRLKSLIDAVADYGKAFDVYSNTYGLILSPIWGSLRVILHIARETGRFQERIVGMLASIGDSLPRFHIYEHLFGKNERLLSAISHAYLDMLRFCVLTKELIHRASTSMFPLVIVLKGVWKPFSEEFDGYMLKFREHVKKVDKEAKIGHMLETDHIRKLQLATQAQTLASRRRERRYRIMTALPTVDYASKHANLTAMRHPGTTTWIQKTSQYRSWISSSQADCLCCYGITGAGKSVMAASVKELLDQTVPQWPCVVLYYYCDYADVASLTPKTIICSLLRQLFRRLPDDRFGDDCQFPFEEEDIQYSNLAMSELVTQLLLEIQRPYFVLDGVDQLDRDSQTAIMEFLNVQMSRHPTMKLFVTSRSEEIIVKTALKRFGSLYLQASTVDRDISSYVHHTLNALEDNHPVVLSKHLKDEVLQALERGAQGMFLWAKFQLFDIRDALTEHAVRTVLENLPKDLEETYLKILGQACSGDGNEHRVETISKVFYWLSAARRPLRLAELEQAIGIDPTDTQLHFDRTAPAAGRRIISQCRNLVVLHESTDTVSFAHHTVQQFVFTSCKKDVLPLSLRMTQTQVDALIGDICLAYLSFADFETQIIKVSQPVSICRSDVEQMLWWGVPLGRHVRRLLTWARPGQIAFRASERAQIRIPLQRQAPPSEAIRQKYILLDYITEFWPFHVATMRKSAPSWARFENIALYKELLFDHRPWLSAIHQRQVDNASQVAPLRKLTLLAPFLEETTPAAAVSRALRQCRHTTLIYTWAVGNGLSAFLELVEREWADSYTASIATGERTVFYAFIDHITSPQGVHASHGGLWHPEFLQSIARIDVTDLSNDLLYFCSEEYRRWASFEGRGFDLLLEDAILLCLRQDDRQAFQKLVSYHVRTLEVLENMFVRLNTESQLTPWALKLLLHCRIPGTPRYSRLWQFCFSLRTYLELVEQILEQNSQALSGIDICLKECLLVTCLAFKRSPEFILVLSRIRPGDALRAFTHFECLSTESDWRFPISAGASHSYAKLRDLMGSCVQDILMDLDNHVHHRFPADSDDIREMQLQQCFDEDDLISARWSHINKEFFFTTINDMEPFLHKVQLMVQDKRYDEHAIRFLCHIITGPQEKWELVVSLKWPKFVISRVLQSVHRTEQISEKLILVSRAKMLQSKEDMGIFSQSTRTEIDRQSIIS